MLCPFKDGQIGRRCVARPDGFDEIGIEVRLAAEGERRHLQTAQAQHQCRQEPDGPGAHHRGALRPPDAQPALNFVGLDDALFDHRHRLQQHAHFS
jgi:hypothetical protein